MKEIIEQQIAVLQDKLRQTNDPELKSEYLQSIRELQEQLSQFK